MPALLFFHTHASLIVFVCPSVLFQSCCSHARVFGKTLLHEFPISYSRTLWHFIFLSLMQDKLNMPNGHYYRLCSSGRSNHLIKIEFYKSNSKLFLRLLCILITKKNLFPVYTLVYLMSNIFVTFKNIFTNVSIIVNLSKIVSLSKISVTTQE